MEHSHRAPILFLLFGLCLISCQKEQESIGEIENSAEKKKATQSQTEKDPFAEFRVEEVLDEALDEEPFLRSEYEPLETWMDERFEIKFRNMKPELIFDQVPLNDVHYELSDLPESGKSFELESVNISRRELLKKIADHWNLEMSYTFGEDGNPNAVKVVGNEQ